MLTQPCQNCIISISPRFSIVVEGYSLYPHCLEEEASTIFLMDCCWGCWVAHWLLLFWLTLICPYSHLSHTPQNLLTLVLCSHNGWLLLSISVLVHFLQEAEAKQKWSVREFHQRAHVYNKNKDGKQRWLGDLAVHYFNILWRREIDKSEAFQLSLIFHNVQENHQDNSAKVIHEGGNLVCQRSANLRILTSHKAIVRTCLWEGSL